MQSRIRPSIRDLTDSDFDQLAFPELESERAQPSVKVQRTRPPAVLSTSQPPPVPIIPKPPTAPAASTAEDAPKPTTKPKSRFALQREREAAERASANSQQDDSSPRGALPMMSGMSKLVGQVVERSTDAVPLAPSFEADGRAPGPFVPSPLSSQSRTGFPASARNMFPRKPPVASTSQHPRPDHPADLDAGTGTGDPQSVDSMLASISAENDRVLAGMTEEQILEEQRQIRESLGLSEDVLKMLAARGRQKMQTNQAPTTMSVPKAAARPAPRGAPGSSGKGKAVAIAEADEEEGSPEYIRRHFFPDEPANPNLAWMSTAPPDEQSSTGELQWAFDIDGDLLHEKASHPPATSSDSHHVSSSSSFSISSLMALTSSTVPSQRSTALTVLRRILTHPSHHATTLGAKTWNQLQRDAAQKAGWALRDTSASVVSASSALATAVMEHAVESPHAPARDSAPGAEAPPTVLSAFLSSSPLAPLASQLAHPIVSPSSLQQSIPLLRAYLHLTNPHSTTKSPEIDALLSNDKLLENFVRRFIAVTWPPSADAEYTAPQPQALEFLRLLACSSCDAARALWDRKLVEPTLRFISIAPWEVDAPGDRALVYKLVSETFALWTTIGRYGIGTSMRTKAVSLLDTFEGRVESTIHVGSSAPVEDVELSIAYLQLLSVWTVAAIDPHVTSHDILWTHVEGWAELAMAGVQRVSPDGAGGDVMLAAAAADLLARWLEGSKVNKPWRGEEQRGWIREQLGQACESGGRIKSAVDSAQRRLADTVDTGDVELLLSILRLSRAYEEDSNPPTPPLLRFDSGVVAIAVRSLAAQDTQRSTRLLVSLLPFVDDAQSRLSATLDALKLLQAGEEVAAHDLIDWVISTTGKPSDTTDASSSALHEVAILRPFFTFAIVSAAGGRVVGPMHPTPHDIKLTATLHPFASDQPILGEDWPLLALNELLRSGTSPVFQQLPKGWDATELQVVRSSLALACALSDLDARHRLPPSLLVYDLIKVFMLEKDNTTTGTVNAETDLFRDEVVQTSMLKLLEPIRLIAMPQQLIQETEAEPVLTLEGVSSTVSSAPFYQLYTDLVGLYDSISLSHPIFTLMLLPPLSMAYPVDYRRLLWMDYAHLLAPVRLSVEDAIADRADQFALSAYLYPAETNEAMLAAYVEALVSGKVGPHGPFLELVALHHVASTLFEVGSERDLVARKLAQTLVRNGSQTVVDRLLSYEQPREAGQAVRIPPQCFATQEDEGWVRRRARLNELLAGTSL